MLHVLLETHSPRARYVARHVFERMLGWPIDLVGSREELRSIPGARLSYGALPVEGVFHVPASGWLGSSREAGMTPWSSGTGKDLRLFNLGSRLDVFAAIFHLIALEEEYSIAQQDEHGRIQVGELTLVRSAAHELPIADRWALDLAGQLRTAFPELPEPIRHYSHVLTVDMDNGLKYGGRPLPRALGASVKDLAAGKTGQFIERWNVRFGRAVDPYVRCVDRLAEVRGQVDRMIAFVLTRGEGRFDHAARIDHPLVAGLLARLREIAEIGLHPSYESSRNERMIRHEREELARAVDRHIDISRQHFLRWRMPGTFRALAAEGFKEDHSMGFTDRIGYRAGTCTPFPWYDLERDEETALMLHPFAVMDSALADRTGEGLQRAVADLKRMSDAVRAVKGTFVSVWHDRFLSGHQAFIGGPEAMRELVDHAQA